MKKLSPLIHVQQAVRLRRPYLLAAGPGTGNAGLLAVDYMRRQLSARLFAEVEPDNFFTPPFILKVEEGLLRLEGVPWEGEKPENRFFYLHMRGARDLILFTGDGQPLPGKSSELAYRVIEVAAAWRVSRLYIAGAFATDIHHQDEPAVLGMASSPSLLAYLEEQGISPVPPMSIAFNLNVFLSGAALQQGMEVVGLVAEVPFYTVEQANPRASRALVRCLSRLLGREVDTTDLDAIVAAQDDKLSARIQELHRSPDEKAAAFLDYLEVLEKRRQEKAAGAAAPARPNPSSLPDSLRPIAELYQKARQDRSQVPRLVQELNRLSHEDRLQVLRVLGGDLLDLVQREKP